MAASIIPEYFKSCFRCRGRLWPGCLVAESIISERPLARRYELQDFSMLFAKSFRTAQAVAPSGSCPSSFAHLRQISSDTGLINFICHKRTSFSRVT
jgi:hypothetical protein